ncbi:MAG: hypothetical protein C5B50_27775 [Verrucomicrobia bacterium]|nr:MAG: hypothetical protein C5B50_27775 [Verrucomicrobiota bacterium]
MQLPVVQLQDEDSNPLMEALLEADEKAIDDPPLNPDGARDPLWLRWAKFASIVLLPAFVLGVTFVFASYFTQYSGRNYTDRSRAERFVQRDTWEGMQWRFLEGVCLGGGLGLIYVGRCIVRRSDP